MPTLTVIGSKMLHPLLALYCHFRFEFKYPRHFMMYHKRGIQFLQQRILSLLDIIQPTSPFAFYLHISSKTKEKRNFKALFSLSSKTLNWTSVSQQCQKQALQAWQKGIFCLPSAFVLTEMDGSSIQTWNDRNAVKRKQRWTKLILSSNIYKVIFKIKSE